MEPPKLHFEMPRLSGAGAAILVRGHEHVVQVTFLSVNVQPWNPAVLSVVFDRKRPLAEQIAVTEANKVFWSEAAVASIAEALKGHEAVAVVDGHADIVWTGNQAQVDEFWATLLDGAKRLAASEDQPRTNVSDLLRLGE